MNLTMHSCSVPIFQRMLGNLLKVMDKAEAHAAARKFSPDAYLPLRLAPDMLPFSKQIQIASDNAKGCAARLAGQDIPAWADDETSFAQLRERLQRTLDYVAGVPASAFEGAEGREVVLKFRNRDPLVFTGEDYLRFFALPNFFFHVTTAYALLRHAGVDLGKGDYLGG
jgi:uncharacterized protein